MFMRVTRAAYDVNGSGDRGFNRARGRVAGDRRGCDRGLAYRNSYGGQTQIRRRPGVIRLTIA